MSLNAKNNNDVYADATVITAIGVSYLQLVMEIIESSSEDYDLI